MSGSSIHLMLSSAEGGKEETLKAAFVPLNGAFHLNLLHSNTQLSTLHQSDLNVLVFSGASDGTSWQEAARILRLQNPLAYFILVSETESLFSSITQGADLLIRPDEIKELPFMIGALLKRSGIKPQQGREQVQSIVREDFDNLDELKQKNSELEKINYELDRFVYSASHDLRAPLTSVLGLLDILRNELGTGENQYLINLMEESILKLDNTIRDIVAYSRNNRTEVCIEPLRVQPIISEIINELKYLESDQIHLSDCIKAEDEGVFPGDRARLATILKNLISNAIRYRHPARSPEVSIKIHREQGVLLISVADNGQGINDNHLSKIFDMFYRTSDQSTGSGLGLYIVRETVRKMNGEIEVSSRVNQGTVFHISLPLQADEKSNNLK